MSDEKSKANLVSIIVLFALIIANVLLSMPPRSALSDNKAVRKGTSAPAVAQDFGAETIEPQGGKQYSAPDAQPLPLDLAEEPLQDKPAAADLTAAAQPSPAADQEEAADAEKNAEESSPDSTLTTSLNGNEIDIAALVKAFSKMTKRNYIVDNSVKGKVAIHLATPVSVPEALRIFESVLLLKGFTTVPLGNNTWKVITAKDAKQTTIPMLDNAVDKGSDALVTQLIRLKNTQASELQQVLSQFVSKDGMINAFGATNALILIDSAANIKRLTKLVEQLDVPALDQDITIVPILHAEAKDVADKINAILGSSDDDKQNVAQNPLLRTSFRQGIPPRAGMQPPANTTNGVSTTGERRQLPLKLIPDERTNSLIVVADQLVTDKVRALAEQLDSPVDRSGGKFYVYRLQHADADEMSQIINSVISGSSGSTGTTSSKSKLSSDSSSSNSDTTSSFGRSRLNQALSQQNNTASTTGSTHTSSGAVSGKVNLEGEVTVAADTSTNSLVINASRGDYLKLKELIDLLDVKRRQVLVEATILEVSLDHNYGAGVEFQTSGGTDEAGGIAQTNFGGITNLLTNPAALTDLTIAAASSGSIVLPGGLTLPSQAVLINAVSRNQNVNVLSTPTVLAIDNQEAEIKVGENVPFVTSTSTNQTNLNNTFNQIERQDVGIKLKITPQISAGDFVVLKIFVEISDVVLGTRNDPNGPTTNIRTTETMVEVKSNQMVVTGGLIKDRVEEASRGVPYFEDIPVLGHLFRRDDDARERTNLLVFITPRIITDQFVAREQTLNKRDDMESAIHEQQTEPDRHDVLHSSDMDRVVESQPVGDTLPTVVRPPVPVRAEAPTKDGVELLATKRTEDRLKKLSVAEGSSEQPVFGSTGDRPATAAGGDDEIEIQVAPRLPGEKGTAESPAEPQVSDLQLNHTVSTTRTVTTPETPSAGGRTYVVLREIGRESNNRTPSPFTYVDSEKTLGLNLPLNTETASGKFFRTGERYTFQSGGLKLHFVCLGKYSSLSDAGSRHPDLGNAKKWYTLSTKQAVSLSDTGWREG
jgi:general secretion pathway protein D